MIKRIAHGMRVAHSELRESSKSRRRSPDWDKVRDSHVEKNPMCYACGSKNRLQVHHIAPFSNHPELELDPSNLITLCMDVEECHFRIGHGSSFKRYNPNVVDDAKNFLVSDTEARSLIVENAKKNRLD